MCRLFLLACHPSLFRCTSTPHLSKFLPLLQLPPLPLHPSLCTPPQHLDGHLGQPRDRHHCRQYRVVPPSVWHHRTAVHHVVRRLHALHAGRGDQADAALTLRFRLMLRLCTSDFRGSSKSLAPPQRAEERLGCGRGPTPPPAAAAGCRCCCCRRRSCHSLNCNR